MAVHASENQPNTAIAAALLRAGYTTPNERLLRIATEAWASCDSAAKRRDFVALRLNGEMTWSLIESWQPALVVQAVGWLLNRAKQEIEALRPKQIAGREPAATYQDSAGTQTEHRSEPTSHNTASRRGSSAASRITKLADKQAAAAEVTLRVRLSMLDTVLIDDKPIGDCTAGEARTWAERRKQDARDAGRDARFALSLAANLDGGSVLRDWWKNPAEVDALYESAGAADV
jgi:hypothetical protein